MVYFVAFFVLLMVVSAMAIGVILGRKPITGSCGGVGAALNDPNYVCDYCGGDESKCEERQEQLTQNARDLSYDAMSNQSGK